MMNFYFLYRLSFLTFFMCLLIQYKYSIKKSSIVISSVIFIIWVINSVIYNLTDIDFVNSIYPIAVSIPAFLCFLYVSKHNTLKVLFSFLTVCNFGMLTSYVGLLGYYFSQSFKIRIIFEFLSVILTFVLVLKLFRKPYFKILNTLDKGFGLLCSFSILLSSIIYLLLYYPTEFYNHPKDIPVIFLVFALMFFFYAILYNNFENITQIYQFQHDKEVILLQTDMQKKEYEAIINKINTIRIYRHDLRHHINVINTFLNDNNISEAKIYLDKLNDNLNNTVIEQYCENYMINVILSTYIGKAKNENIDVTCKAIISKDIKIDNIELGLIFTNAIENAIAACMKIENIGERKLMIICKEHFDQIYIQVSNPFIGNIKFNGEFPLSSSKDHGIGTRSIAAIAEKYDGVFSFKTEGNIFKTTVILNTT